MKKSVFTLRLLMVITIIISSINTVSAQTSNMPGADLVITKQGPNISELADMPYNLLADQIKASINDGQLDKPLSANQKEAYLNEIQQLEDNKRNKLLKAYINSVKQETHQESQGVSHNKSAHQQGNDEGRSFSFQDTAELPLIEDFEGGEIPEGWTNQTNGTGATAGWFVSDSGSSGAFDIPPHTFYAVSNDDMQDDDSSNDYLITPQIDATSETDSTTLGLTFDSFFNGKYGQSAYVKISFDEGNTWQTVREMEPYDAWNIEEINLEEHIDGNSDFIIGFHADDNGGWASGWAIDNVEVSTYLQPPVNLQATNEGYEVTLNWEYPDNITPPSHHIVYRNYNPIDTISEGNSYSEVFDEYGPQTYHIRGFYQSQNQTTLLSAPAHITVQGEIVDIPDDNFRAAINQQLGYQPPQDTTHNPTEYEMSLIQDLNANASDIESIAGAEFLTNISSLSLKSNQISDLEPLSGLNTLIELSISGNQIENIESLNGLTSLNKLNIGANSITDISPLSGLSNLSELELFSNDISDITPLADLAQLTFLNLDNNALIDITPVSAFTNLNTLSLGNNEIIDISPIADCNNLQSISLNDNRIRNLIPLAELNSLTALNIYNNEFSDIAPLVYNEGLGDSENDFIHFKGCPLSKEAIEEHIPLLSERTFDTLMFDSTFNAAAPCFPYPERKSYALTDTLSWQANFDNVENTSYDVYLGEAPDSLQLVLQGTTNESFEISLEQSNNYWWHVQAINEADTLYGGVWQFYNDTITEFYIPDTNFRMVINEYLGYGYPETLNHHPTDTEMAGISSLDGKDRNIASIEGAQYLTNITNLDLENNSISNVSKLNSLTNLEDLILTNNSISDISPLASLTNLSHLYLDVNSISDVNPLSGLTNLIWLNLDNNSVSDISPLSELVNLSWLLLYNNSVTDISPLSNLSNLTALYLHQNSISDISPLSEMSNLSRLYLPNNLISDISPIEGLTNLTSLSLGHNSIDEISSLSGLTDLTELWLDDNAISDISVLSDLINLTELQLGNNSISDICVLSNLTSLIDLRLENNSISDIHILIENNGIGNSPNDRLYLSENPLSKEAVEEHIPILEGRNFEILDYEDTYNPLAPCYPNPNRGEALYNEVSTLNWQGNFDNLDDVTYNVYFGDNPDSLVLEQTGLSSPACEVSTEINNFYYWRVEAIHNSDTLYGGIWDFFTSDPPEIAIEPDSINEELDWGRDTTYYLTISNNSSGLVPLNYSISFASDSSSESKSGSLTREEWYKELQKKHQNLDKPEKQEGERDPGNKETIFRNNNGDYLVIDPDSEPNSGEVIEDLLVELGFTVDYTSNFNSISDYEYQAVFVTLGVYPENYVLQEPDVQGLTEYLDNGGNLYMEGADTWYYDELTSLHSYFYIEPVADGTSDLSIVEGVTGTFTEGVNNQYIGHNNYIDQLAPKENAFTVFKNQEVGYDCGIAYKEDYSTIGTSFILGELEDNPISKAEILQSILDFFIPIIKEDWLSITPSQGAISPGETKQVDLQVNGADLPGLGEFTKQLQITTNDPDNENVPYDVTINASEIFIPDSNFRMVINEHLGYEYPETVNHNPTEEEMSGIIELDGHSRNIESLEGAQYLTNITHLILSDNAITEISPLSETTNLNELILYSNLIGNISPLSELINLNYLHLNANNITDITPLSDLSNLNRLYLGYNSISDIEPLSNLTNLQFLALYYNSVSNISALSELENLIELSIVNNPITNPEIISNFSNLNYLNISGLDLVNIEFLKGLTNIDVLYLQNNAITDIYPLIENMGVGDSPFDELHIQNNPLSKESIEEHIPVLEDRTFNELNYDSTYHPLAPCYPQPIRYDTLAANTLSWSANYDSLENVTYDVYLGTNSDSLVLYYPGLTESFVNVQFDANMQYYWRIESIYEEDTLHGGLWSFETNESSSLNDHCFIVSTNEGIHKIDEEGNSTYLFPGTNVETHDGYIYTVLYYDSIRKYRIDGTLQSSINIPSEVISFSDFVFLPENGFAFLDHINDKVYFTDMNGNYETEVNIPNSDGGHLQNLDGIKVDNKLIVSENGNNEVFSVSLDDYSTDIFADFSHLSGWLGSIEYHNELYYLCQSREIYSFTETTDPNIISTLPDGNITGIALHETSAYVTINFEDKVMKINLLDGAFEDFSDDLAYPDDIETFYYEDHFNPVWSGNAYQPMTFMVGGASLEEVPLEAGDEIGIFDGELCVGAGVLTSTLDAGNDEDYITIIASKDDGGGNGYSEGNAISYKLWDSSEELELEVTQVEFPLDPEFTFEFYTALETNFVNLLATTSFSQQLNYQQGWNMTSFAVEPEENNLQTILQPIIDNDELVKVIDEQGNIIEEMPWGWVNNIGAMSPSEGYYVKVTADNSITTTGAPVTLPYDIPLTGGWNMTGYPSMTPQNATGALAELMDNNTLIKVIDEQGNIIENMPWGWVNNVGSFQAGEGYYIKVTEDATLTIEEPVTRNGQLPESYKVPIANHFTPVYQGNPYEPMQMVVDASSLNLKQGDELALFSNGQCVGAAGYNPDRDYQYLTTSKNDSQTAEQDGYLEGTPVALKVYRKADNTAYHVPYEPIEGPSGYKPLLTKIIKASALTTGVDDEQAQSVILYQNKPNPLKDKTIISYYLPESGEVSLSIVNLHGQEQLKLVDQIQKSGLHQAELDGNSLSPGIYLYQLNYQAENGKEQQLYKKMTIVR